MQTVRMASKSNLTLIPSPQLLTRVLKMAHPSRMPYHINLDCVYII